MNKSFFLASAVAVMASMSSMASAGVLSDFKDDVKQLVLTFPAHEADGYRDTGCDPAQQVQITNDAGEYLYSNNPTCPDVAGAGFDLDGFAAMAPPTVVDEPDEEEEGCDKEVDVKDIPQGVKYN